MASIEEVATEIFRIRLPVPFKLNHVNVYVIRENGRVMLVDTGVPTTDSWQVLSQSFEKLGVGQDELTDIFITHSHPDHMGQLKKIRILAPQAQLHLHRQELEMLKRMVPADKQEQIKQRQAWLLTNGVAETVVNQFAQLSSLEIPEIKPADSLHQGGEKLLPKEDWEVIWTPGHTDGHCVIYNRKRRTILSGDHLLGRISSNVGSYPGSSSDPLGNYLNSLQSISQLDLAEVYPAHGDTFTNYQERIENLIQHHKRRLEKMYQSIVQEPKTAMQIVHEIWRNRLDWPDQFQALGETLSHLERLVQLKRVIREKHNNLVYYWAS